MADWGAEVIGLNCSIGPAIILDALERMSEVSDRPLSAQPNAGLPRAVGDRKMYMASPDYMAQYARRLLGAGARLIGGCCGTSPDHIRRIRETVSSVQSPPTGIVVTDVPSQKPKPSKEVPLATRSQLGRKLAEGGFVTSVELVPPRGWDGRGLAEASRELAAHGVDVAAIPDSPLAQGRMSAIPAALIIERDTAMETMVHYACRNRNMVGMVSDMLGAAAAGLRNVLVVTGDLPREGPYADATPVFDIDSIGLTNVIRHLNRGIDPGGNSIGQPTNFVVGVALNQGARDIERELERYAYKADAGAHFAITQPVFDVEELARFLERSSDWQIPVIAGIWPLRSLRNAEFMANEVPGVRVPASVIARMAAAEAGGRDAAAREGLDIASEILGQTRAFVSGAHVGTGGSVQAAIDVLSSAGVLSPA